MTYAFEHTLKDIEPSQNDDELFTLSGAGVMVAACVLSPASCSSP